MEKKKKSQSLKSETCFSKDNKPLSYYETIEDAIKGANFLSEKINKKMKPYKCEKCNKFHIKPEEVFFNKNDLSKCSCVDHSGNKKDSYSTKFDAEKMIKFKKEKDNIDLYIFKCPENNGYHITSHPFKNEK